ncbi:MAG: tetratricopeptide repeat protein [Candidatus Omnitrophota bacterium]
MLAFKRQLVFIGLWFTVLVLPCHAGEAQIQAKSKSLAHYIMAVINDLNGDNQEAMKEYRKSVKFDTRQPLPHLRLASYYTRLGRLTEAVEHLRIVVKLQPELSQAHYLLALIYSSQKKYGLAANEYELILKTASKKNPDSIEAHTYLAQLYYSLRKYPQSIDQLLQILQVQPRNISATYLLGTIYLDLDQRLKAKESFRKILVLEPEHDGALNSLAYVYAEGGVNLDEALKMIRKALEGDPSNGAYYDTLGWVLFKKGFKAESLMALEKAEEYIVDPIIYEHIGDVYNAVNEPALARKFWLKSLALDPKQPKISQRLERLNRTSASIQEVNYNPTR